MGLPEKDVIVSPEQVELLNRHLSGFRHNINNHLSLVVAATELLRRKPETSARMLETLAEQPQKIMTEVKTLSDEVERVLQIRRTPPA